MSFPKRAEEVRAQWHRLRYDVPLWKLWALNIGQFGAFLGLLYGLKAMGHQTLGELFLIPVITVCGLFYTFVPILTVYRFFDWLGQHETLQNTLMLGFLVTALVFGGYGIWTDRYTFQGRLIIYGFGIYFAVTILAAIWMVASAYFRMRRHRNNTPSQ